MNTYDIENKLNRKVDDWKFHSLESTVDKQKYDIQDLEKKIGHLETKNSNYYNLLNDLINQLQYSELKNYMGDVINFDSLKQYL